MKRQHILILTGLLAVALVGVMLGGAQGVGLVGGYLFGSTVALLGAAWVGHVVKTRPRDLLKAVMGTFSFKLAGLLIGVLPLRYLPSLAQTADWRTFIVAYGLACFLGLLLVLPHTRAAAPTKSLPPQGVTS